MWEDIKQAGLGLNQVCETLFVPYALAAHPSSVEQLYHEWKTQKTTYIKTTSQKLLLQEKRE